MAVEIIAKLAAGEEESKLKEAEDSKEVRAGKDGDGELTPTGAPKKTENVLNVPEGPGGDAAFKEEREGAKRRYLQRQLLYIGVE